MKILIFDGYLTADAETGQTSKGSNYLRFKVGCSNFVMGESKTDWLEVISFNENENESIGKYLKKGSHVAVVGIPNTTVNPGKDGRLYVNTSVRAYHIEFANGGGKKDKQNGDEPEISVNAPTDPAPSPATDYADAEKNLAPTVQPPVAPAASDDGDDDELPF